MPAILWINPDWAAAVAVSCVEGTACSLMCVTLRIFNEIFVVAGSMRHESDAEDAAVFGVTKPFYVPPFPFCRLKPTSQNRIGKRVIGTRPGDICGDLDKIKSLDGDG